MKKIFLIVFLAICSIYVSRGQFTIVIHPTGGEPAIEGEVVKYTIAYDQLPASYRFASSVTNGNIIEQRLEPSPKGEPYIIIRWDCNPLNGTGDITITELGSGVSGTIQVFVRTFLSDPLYCNKAEPVKQNLLYGQTPAILKISACSRYCNTIPTSPYKYQWQVGDVPIGIFPQVPTTYTDILSNSTTDVPATKPDYQPPTYNVDCIKAYRRITYVTDPMTGDIHKFFSDPAVVSTFNILDPGSIGGGSVFNNGIPVISQIPANGGLCDGYNYNYTWEFSADNQNWTPIGGGVNYPSVPIMLSGFIRRAVECNGEAKYSNSLQIIVAVLEPGTLSGGGSYAFNVVPVVSQTPAAGGSCVPSEYTYIWERSVENGPWVQFGTGVVYPNAGIVGNCRIKRKVQCFSAEAYSNIITFQLYPTTSNNTENLNYTRVNEIFIPGVQSWLQADALATGDKIQTTTYLDDFGRTVQKVIKQGSIKQSATALDPNNISNYQDLVSITDYDALGRVDKGYLPYATPTNPGFYKSNALQEQQSFIDQKYSEPAGSAFTFSQAVFDGSPLNRIVNTKLPGASWNNNTSYNGISNSFEIYQTNENVHIWNIGYDHNDKPIDAGIYPDNKLIKIITHDEKDKLIIEFKDLSGNVILKKVQEKEIGPDLDTNGYKGWLCTYYVYDDYCRLRYTISPMAVETMYSSGNWQVDDAMKQGWCFYKEFDQYGRMVVNHSADGGENHYVYDSRDRLVLSQKENQRHRMPARPNQWSVALYDENDREVITGLINDNRDINSMQAMVNGVVVPASSQNINVYVGSWESINVFNPVVGNFPGTINPDIIVNSVDYYDDYKTAGFNFLQLSASDFAPNSSQHLNSFSRSLRIQGFATGGKTRVLDDKYDNGNLNDERFLSSGSYYNDKGQMIENFNSPLKNGSSMIASLYDLFGKLVSTREVLNLHNLPLDGLIIINKYDYDLLSRPIRLYKLFTKKNTDVTDLAKYKKLYELHLDEYGRTITKMIGADPQNTGAPMETQDISYNIQGWITGINKDYALANGTGSSNMNSQWARRFGAYFGYENSDNKFLNSQWNQNITGVIWRSQGDNIPRKYNYEYDNVNRFKAARFLQKDNPQASDNTFSNLKSDLSVFITGYNANGNITGMKQTGLIPGTDGGVLIDDLQYSYFPGSNKLKAINDLAFNGNNNQNGKQGDFKNIFPSTGSDYDYDENGNLKNDRNKGLVANQSDGIIYNFLDLPQQITIKDVSKTEYTYDAAGNKLSGKLTQLTPNSPPPITTYYLGPVVYEGQAQTPGANENLVPRYIAHEEGRLRITNPVAAWSGPSGMVNYLETRGNILLENTNNTWGVWDYFIKDNLQNVRLVLTEEYHQQQMLCSMENSPIARKNEEEATFGNSTYNEVAATRYSTNVLPWQPSSFVSKLIFVNPGVSPATTIGPNTILKVMAGDMLNGLTKYYYQSATQSTNNNNSIISNIANSLLGFLQSGLVTGIVKDNISGTFLSSSGGPLIPFFNDNNPPPSNTRTPKAFLNYIFFDEQFRYVKESSGAVPVTALQGNQTSSSGDIIFNAKATKNGYVYVYLSNESSNIPVYFDDFRVTHTRGPILEDNAYYPFGLKTQGISSAAALKPVAKYGYQGTFNEHDDQTRYNEFAVRTYDPQIGRWIQVDPIVVQAGMYSGMSNNPINCVDILGTLPDWYQKEGTNDIDWFDTDKEIKGYKHIGKSFSDWYVDAAGNRRWTNFEPDGTYTCWIPEVKVAAPSREAMERLRKQCTEALEAIAIDHNSYFDDNGNLKKFEYNEDNNWFWNGTTFITNAGISMFNSIKNIDINPISQGTNLASTVLGVTKYVFTSTPTDNVKDAVNFFSDVHNVEDLAAGMALVALTKGDIKPVERTIGLQESVAVNKINYLQTECSVFHKDGQFNIFGNALGLKSGEISPGTLRINVWQNADGSIWTLDHRRLAAFELSGLTNAEVTWVSPNTVMQQKWKFRRPTDGRSIKINFGDGSFYLLRK